jgi:hypothetical protein
MNEDCRSSAVSQLLISLRISTHLIIEKENDRCRLADRLGRDDLASWSSASHIRYHKFLKFLLNWRVPVSRPFQKDHLHSPVLYSWIRTRIRTLSKLTAQRKIERERERERDGWDGGIQRSDKDHGVSERIFSQGVPASLH